jgi:hypothetical protein
MKKKRNNALKVVEAHLKSYKVFLKNRDFLYQMKLRTNYLFFTQLRNGYLSEAQRTIRKYWFAIRGIIRIRREAQRFIVKRAFRKFTLIFYHKAKKELEIIINFRKYRRTPCDRGWSVRSLKKGAGNKDDRFKRSIRRKMRETSNGHRKYFKFTEDLKYQKDLYEAEKKFRENNFKRSKSENTIRTKYRQDYRNTFVKTPKDKDLLKEIKVIEEIEKRPNKTLLEKYEYKNLKKISCGEINQRV